MEILTPNYLKSILDRLGARDFDVTPIYDQLRKSYDDGSHLYHSWNNHIEPGMVVIHRHILETEHPNAIMCAWVYHDEILVAGASDNEEKSADSCARMLASIKVPEPKIHEVRSQIIATKHDKLFKGYGDSDLRFICDIDLSFLALPHDEFVANTDLIRQEYWFVSDEEFRLGRREFCRKMLRRGPIFQTEFMHKLYERNARRNLVRSVRSSLFKT